MELYPYDSISFPVTITDAGVRQDLSYTDGATMNNPASGYGILWFTCFDHRGNVVNDTNGVPIQNRYCAWSETRQQGEGKIVAGLLKPGEYTVQPYYGVNDASSEPSWRKQERIFITINGIVGSTDTPV